MGSSLNLLRRQNGRAQSALTERFYRTEMAEEKYTAQAPYFQFDFWFGSLRTSLSLCRLTPLLSGICGLALRKVL